MSRVLVKLVMVGGLLWPSYLHANPTGGTVVGGQATIGGEGTGAVIVDQQTERGIINWQDFSIGAGESVRFNQPSTSSVTANRVIGADPSQIMGQMSATGQLLLITRTVLFLVPMPSLTRLPSLQRLRIFPTAIL